MNWLLPLFYYEKNKQMVLGILQFLKLSFLFYPNKTKFLIFWYFIKTIVLLQNYKNTLYPNRAL
jgi:hypothetical protein